MKTSKLIILAILISAALNGFAQIKIPDTRVSFNFPNQGWKYLETTKVNNDAVVYLYSYSGSYVIDSVGDTIIPFMRIYVRKNYSGTVYDMAYSRFMSQPFQSLDEYIYNDGSIGYLGAYTNDEDNKDYEFRMVYMKDRNNCIEIRLETSRDNYDDFDEEFLLILKSVKTGK